MSKQQVLLQLQRVKCVDETGGATAEKFGNDEIALAGVGIDATGQTYRLPPFSVYPHFDDGEVKAYTPPKTLFVLDVPHEGTFPKTCVVEFLLAEIDQGGFATVADEAYKKITAEVAAKKQQQQPNSLAVGSIAVGLIWAAVKPHVEKYLKDLITQGIQDDVFPPRDVSVDISSADFHWGDGTKLSPEATVEFRGHDGVYYLTYYWEIRTV